MHVTDVPAPRLRVAPGVALAAAATLLTHLLTNGRYGVFRDEFYYLACARHLAWGYVDHPPMIALLAGLARAIGESPAALRLLPALAHVALVLLVARLSARFGGGAWAQGLAALGAFVAPIFLGSATVLTMNPFEQVLWCVVALGLVSAIERGGTAPWVVLGVATGLGLLTKHSMAFLVGSLVVALLATPERRVLRGRGPWIAAAIAAALVAPHVAWQILHGFPTLEFLRNAAAHKNLTGTPLAFLGAQVMLIHPVNLPLALGGLAWLAAAPAARRFRGFAYAWALLFVAFVASHGKSYYLAAYDGILLAAGGVALERALAGARLRWLRPALATVMLAGAAVTAPLVVPILAPEAYVRYAARLGFTEPQSERHRPAKLPQLYADMFGWPEMVAEVASVWNGLSPAERARCAVYASNYGEAGALDYYGPRHGLPPASSGHNSYWLWGPTRPDADMVITVGEDPEDVGASFEDVTVVRTFRHPWNMPYESDLPICIGRRPRMTWAKIWPETKKFI